MLRTTSILSRTVTIVCTFLMVNLAIPMGLPKMVADNLPERAPQRKQKPTFKTQPMSAKDMKALQGKWMKNPYIAGSNKFSVNYKGVDLMTGNFTTSATDMTFEGGYGIPINVTRSYSANSSEEGPMGEGWNLSVDVRNTAGGLLKGPSAPIRSIPNGFKERHSDQLDDPNAVAANGDAAQPAEAVLSTDASGKEETQQRDVDGVITTPPWDKNANNVVYEDVIDFNGNDYKIMVSNDVTTPDGTVYHYEKRGWYHYKSGGVWQGGVYPHDDSSEAKEPSNILKITSVTDRHGNVTEYHYDTVEAHAVTFTRSNGLAYENPLTSIAMPNGHVINFAWGDGETTGPVDRIVAIDDNLEDAGRKVEYGYNESEDLITVASPEGLVTHYGYETSGRIKAGEASPYSDPGAAGHVITSITDPRGLTTDIYYSMEDVDIFPYGVTMRAVKTYKIVAPNGVETHFANAGPFENLPDDSYWYSTSGALVETAAYADLASGASTPFQVGYLKAWKHSSEPVLEVGMSGMGGGALGTFTAGEGSWQKQYDSRTQDLLLEIHYMSPMITQVVEDRMMEPAVTGTKVSVAKEYNFMGNPLSVTTTEAYASGPTSGYTNTRVQQTDYAYWDETKYFQQKGTRIQTGASTYRYTLTDYFDSNATTGKKGQTYRVYSPQHATLGLNTGISVPGWADSDDYWKYRLYASAGNHSAEFDYDSKGRAIDVWKLQKVVSGTPTYVQTHTTYGGDDTPHWGQAYQVVEDYGSGKINRTTTTNGYTSWGTANDVTDAANHTFHTNYDKDGRIVSVVRTDCDPDQDIVTYTYNDDSGSNDAQKFQVARIEDGLSGVTQDFTYCDSGGGRGQVASITETNGGTDYTTSYLYTGEGDRETATYVTDSGTVKWGYGDYVALGDPSGPGRVFQTMTKLDSSTAYPTSEEFHYAYDGDGKLRVAAFAQTPKASFTPSTGQPWYDSSHLANSRARAYYVYDAGGRLTQLNHWWDTWNTSTLAYNTPEAVLNNTCDYEVTTGTSNMNRGLKTNSYFGVQDSGDSSTFEMAHQQQYAYDSASDYLTQAKYDDDANSSWDQTDNWTYDAAGNRNDATTVDNLNRATTISSVSRTYDILGNTLTIGSSKTMTWDVLNRMESLDNGTTTTDYAYRADGIRVSKRSGSKTTSYIYDGQMPVEESLIDSANSNNDTLTRYTAGARGIDRTEHSTAGGTQISYPLYDAYGNTCALLTKSGGTYSLGNQRSYGAWGGTRIGTSTGHPKLNYAASQGHLQDEESGFTYMRARFYDPSAGRFLSEDPERQPTHYYVYCNNDPVNNSDWSGKEYLDRMTDVFMNFVRFFSRSRSLGGFAGSLALRRLADTTIGDLLALADLAVADGIKWMRAAQGGGEAARAIQGRGIKCFAEAVVGIMYAIQVEMMMQSGLQEDIDALGPMSGWGSG